MTNETVLSSENVKDQNQQKCDVGGNGKRRSKKIVGGMKIITLDLIKIDNARKFIFKNVLRINNKLGLGLY